MGFLVNQGGKLTREEKDALRAINQKRYGLSEEQIENVKLPPHCHVEIYDINKIIKPKSSLNTLEKINHLMKLQTALEEKLEKIAKKRELVKLENKAK